MINGPILVTQRLILRPPGAEDFEGWTKFHGDGETMRFLGGVQERAEAWRGLCGMAGAWHIRGFGMFSMVLRDSGEWIGRTGPWQPDGWPGTEVGWGVLREFAGRGYVREAAIAAIDFAFDMLGWEEVIHIIDPDNTPSIGLAERLGSTNLGSTKMPAPYAGMNVDKYGQTRDAWRTARKQAAG